jgi:hypothetical protein
MLLKFLGLILACVLLVGAQEFQSRARPQLQPKRDPIGDYRVRVSGYINSQEQKLADVSGFVEKLTLQDWDTTLCHALLQVKPPGQQSQQGAQSRNRQSQQNVALWETATYEKSDMVDFFSAPSGDMQSLGDCFYTRSELQANNFNAGPWEQAKSQCGRNQDGTVWTRRLTANDATNHEIERSEAICKTQNDIQWIEFAETIDGTQLFAVHLDVIDTGDAPQADRMGLVTFGLPAMCVIKPRELKSASDSAKQVFSALGLQLPQVGGVGRGSMGGGRRWNLQDRDENINPNAFRGRQ